MMVIRFLGWPLPKTFGPDCGISFKELGHPHSWPIGTNLFTADEALAMFEYALSTIAQSEGEGMKERSSGKAVGACPSPKWGRCNCEPLCSVCGFRKHTAIHMHCAGEKVGDSPYGHEHQPIK